MNVFLKKVILKYQNSSEHDAAFSSQDFEDNVSFEKFKKAIQKVKTIGQGEFNEAVLYKMNESWKKLEKNTTIVLRINKIGDVSEKEIQLTQSCSDLKIGPQLYHVFKLNTYGKKWLTISKKVKDVHKITTPNQIEEKFGKICTFKNSFNTQENVILWNNNVYKRIPHEIILASEAFEGDISFFISKKSNQAKVKHVAKNVHKILDLAGKHGFFHGDIKAKNLLFDSKNEVVMTDFDPKFCMFVDKFNSTQLSQIMMLLFIIELRCQYTPESTQSNDTWDWPLAEPLVKQLIPYLPSNFDAFVSQTNDRVVDKVLLNIRMYGMDEGCLNIDQLVENKSIQWKNLLLYAKTGISIKTENKRTARQFR